jgi:glycosyltransferase involved in cell wall biosynthesis
LRGLRTHVSVNAASRKQRAPGHINRCACTEELLESGAPLIRVALDASYTRQSSGGIPRYGRELAGALRAIPGVEVVELGAGSFAPRGTMRRMAVTAALQLAWYPSLGRRAAARHGADVYHCLLPRGPTTRGNPPLIVTVHDLIPFLFPETMSRWGRFYARATHRHVLLAAERVIVPSRDTASDCVRMLRVPEEKIRVVPMGIDTQFFSAAARASSPEPYVLFVGCPNPRKNLERLQEAVGKLRSRGYPHSLLIAGEDQWGRVKLDAPFVRLLGRVSDERLRQLYADAACLAIPSLHEGFGLPALEAMAAGTPVVASTAGSLPEVTGGAALLVDPYDTAQLTDALECAITDATGLRERGRAHAARFSWRATAEATLQVYGEVV